MNHSILSPKKSRKAQLAPRVVSDNALVSVKKIFDDEDVDEQNEGGDEEKDEDEGEGEQEESIKEADTISSEKKKKTHMKTKNISPHQNSRRTGFGKLAEWVNQNNSNIEYSVGLRHKTKQKNGSDPNSSLQAQTQQQHRHKAKQSGWAQVRQYVSTSVRQYVSNHPFPLLHSPLN